MRIATYNIHGARGRDGKRDLGRIVDVINALDARIVALQEVDSRPGPHTQSRQMEILSERTGLHAIPGPTIVQGDYGYGNVLLTDLPVRAVRQLDLSHRRREPRGAMDVWLDTPEGPLRVLNTHLGLKWTERRSQVRTLLREIREDRLPLVMMGDFNEWIPFLGAIRPLTQQLTPPLRSTATFPSCCPLLPLDRIWIRPAHILARLHAVRNPIARIASDHLPLAGQLELGRTKADSRP